MKAQWILLFLIVLVSCSSVGFVTDRPIDTFTECVAAGNPVQESNPRRCTANDQTFTEEVCVNTCGNGVCEEVVCQAIGCSCPETESTCPTDCVMANSTTFCGTSTLGACSTDADCMTGGCSGQVCQGIAEEAVITTCEYRDCYNAREFGQTCGCVAGACSWSSQIA